MTKLSHRVAERLFAAFNRADEVGGEVRDYLQDKMAHDPRYVRARRAIAKLRGQRFESKQEAVAKAQAAEAKRSAASVPTQGVAPAAAPMGFGDASIKAQVFGKKSCPWSGRAITILERRKVDFDWIDLEEPEHESKLSALTNETKQHTVPFVYLRGQFVGGYNALAEIERLGQLDYALMTQAERDAVPAHARFDIVPRPNVDEIVPADEVPE